MPPRETPSRLPCRKENARRRALPQTCRSGSSRQTSASILSRKSSVRSASAATVIPGRSRGQIREGPFFESTLAATPSEDECEDDDTLNEIIMAIDLLPRGVVGCCYYVARDEKLFLMEDIQFGDVDIIDTRKCS